MFEKLRVLQKDPELNYIKSQGKFRLFKVVMFSIGLILVYPVVFIAILSGIVTTWIYETWNKGLRWAKSEISQIVFQKTYDKFFK